MVSALSSDFFSTPTQSINSMAAIPARIDSAVIITNVGAPSTTQSSRGTPTTDTNTLDFSELIS